MKERNYVWSLKETQWDHQSRTQLLGVSPSYQGGSLISKILPFTSYDTLTTKLPQKCYTRDVYDLLGESKKSTSLFLCQECEAEVEKDLVPK